MLKGYGLKLCHVEKSQADGVCDTRDNNDCCFVCDVHVLSIPYAVSLGKKKVNLLYDFCVNPIRVLPRTCILVRTGFVVPGRCQEACKGYPLVLLPMELKQFHREGFSSLIENAL